MDNCEPLEFVDTTRVNLYSPLNGFVVGAHRRARLSFHDDRRRPLHALEIVVAARLRESPSISLKTEDA